MTPAIPMDGSNDRGLDMVRADHVLDITNEFCPMTFVRTRLALDRLSPGQTLLVLLKGDEPIRNVPRTAAEQGHMVLGVETIEDGTARVLLRRK